MNHESMKVGLIGLSGLARTGKDTFCQRLIEEFEKRGVVAERFALADELKKELDPFLKSQFGISAFTQEDREKDLIRGILVAYGKAKRVLSDGKHWTGILEPKILKSLQEGRVPIVTDIRYMEYAEDEGHWVKNLGGTLVHLTRKNPDGSLRVPPNEDERVNDPKVKAVSDHTLQLPNVADLNLDLRWFTKSFIDQLCG